LGQPLTPAGCEDPHLTQRVGKPSGYTMPLRCESLPLGTQMPSTFSPVPDRTEHP